MDYYSRVKPILNKLQKMNLLDNLQEIHDDLRYYFDRSNIRSLHGMSNNLVQPYIADFLIANTLIYSNFHSKLSLRTDKIRYDICSPLLDIHNEVSERLLKKAPATWVNSYMYNQALMQIYDDPRAMLYRYYFLYNTSLLRKYLEDKLQISYDLYFQMTLFIYGAFYANKKMYYAKSNLYPSSLPFVYKKALQNILDKILSRTFDEMRSLCKDYISYSDNRLFNFYSDSPHIKYPILRDDTKYYCVVPNYILYSLLHGLYFLLDIPHCEASLRQKIASNFEDYVGHLFKHYLKQSSISYRKEFAYNRGQNKTSDWLLWNDHEIVFADCKMKTITATSRAEYEINVDTIDRIVENCDFSRSSYSVYISSLPTGLTKDLVILGTGFGKIFVCYDDYCNNKIEGFPYQETKDFWAYLITVDEEFANNIEYMEQILKVANAYRKAKSKNAIKFDIDSSHIKIISAGDVEVNILSVKEFNNISLFGAHVEKPITDSFITDWVKEKLFKPLLQTEHSN